jgi:peptide/nickel transport system substrate-binding protein
MLALGVDDERVGTKTDFATFFRAHFERSEFCDHDVDERFAKALALQVTDPAAARSAWSELDRRIIDLVPLIPAVVPEGVDFVSKRVGNYQHNPAYGILLAQLWVT